MPWLPAADRALPPPRALSPVGALVEDMSPTACSPLLLVTSCRALGAPGNPEARGVPWSGCGHYPPVLLLILVPALLACAGAPSKWITLMDCD